MTHINNKVSHLQDRVCNRSERDIKTCYLADPKAAPQVSKANTSGTTTTSSRPRTMARRITPTGAIVESESSSSTTTSSTSPPPATIQEQHDSSSQSSHSPPVPVKQTPPTNYDSLPNILDDSEHDLTEESTMRSSGLSSSYCSLHVSLLSSSIISTARESLLSSTGGCYSVTKYPLVDNCGNAGFYTGQLSRDSEKPHGFGHMEYDPRDGVGVVVYEGQWLMGDWCGFGTLTDATCTYQGGFFDNQKHGLFVWQYHHEDSSTADENGRTLTYDGAFSLDSINGKGRMHYPDGSKFWGYWNDKGLPHGRGKHTYVDGRVYDGEFDCGALQGHGRMTWPDGRWYLGEWTDGQRTGLGIEVLPNGKLHHEGTFSNGAPVEASSFPSHPRSRGDFLRYHTCCTGDHSTSRCTLLGKIPRGIHMRKNMRWML